MNGNKTGAIPSLRPEWRCGEHGVPVARYTSRDFADLEARYLWPYAWQMACRAEEIPNAGDYTVYEILDQSILIVRQEDGSIKAYHNFCPHRGTALAEGNGRFQLSQIVCPFHGWKWKIDGACSFVLDEEAFAGGCLDRRTLDLKECQVAVFINCVWINMDPGAAPFDEHVAGIRGAFEATLLDHMYFDWHKSLVLDCNWKAAQEAFFEGYHVPQTHPQLTTRQIKPRPGLDLQKISRSRALNYRVSLFDQGHGFQGSTDGGVRGLGRFPREWMEGLSQQEEIDILIHFHEKFEEELHSMVLSEDVDVARTMRRRPIPEGSDPDAEFQRAIREHYALQGRPIATADALSRVGLAHVFPNHTFLPLYGNVLIYRARPLPDNDPDKCHFEVWSCRTYAEGAKPPRPKVDIVTDPMDPKQMVMFLRQDFSNLPRVQKGMHSRAMQSSLLHAGQEGLITNMHAALDHMLERAPSDQP